MFSLVTMSGRHLPAPLAMPAPVVEAHRELEHAQRYAASARGPATRRPQERDRRPFATWSAEPRPRRDLRRARVAFPGPQDTRDTVASATS